METKDVIIRFAKERELEQVNVLRKQVHTLHASGRPDFFRSDGWDKIEDLVKVRFSSEDAGVVIASQGGQIAGFAFVQYAHLQETSFRPGRDICHIEEFGVDEDYRRCGIASQIIDFIKQDASRRGLKKLELNMWEFNEDALAFYEHMGFQTYRRDMEIVL